MKLTAVDVFIIATILISIGKYYQAVVNFVYRLLLFSSIFERITSGGEKKARLQ